eukprot:TRINITY_DN9799_c0_g1_i1.p1 TRINITY_DN9799_c0_g1~~TRINITY_DN9799_c0_g1_i1.p1  ORF type:complete len:197 (-),score=63.83 TRINITY_DN9799_c0_g1_i1:39-608(-)
MEQDIQIQNQIETEQTKMEEMKIEETKTEEMKTEEEIKVEVNGSSMEMIKNELDICGDNQSETTHNKPIEMQHQPELPIQLEQQNQLETQNQLECTPVESQDHVDIIEPIQIEKDVQMDIKDDEPLRIVEDSPMVIENNDTVLAESNQVSDEKSIEISGDAVQSEPKPMEIDTPSSTNSDLNHNTTIVS